MGHCIDVYLINKSELRNGKIDSVISVNDIAGDNNIIWTELKEGILATPYIKNVREWGKGKTIAKISTDYFGGPGHQTAKLFIDNNKVYDASDEFEYKEAPINGVLKMIGVIAKPGSDEFDTIGLSRYRSNNDFKK